MRTLRVSLAGVFCLALLYLAVLHGLGAILVMAGRPAEALRLRPDASDAASLAAERAFNERQPEKAIELAQRSLLRSPTDVRALRTLGLSQIALNRKEVGFAVMDGAAQLGWRDTPTQLWVLRTAALHRDYNTAIERADGLLRRGIMPDEMLAVLHAIAADPAARSQLVVRLMDDPPWQTRFWRLLGNLTPENLADHERILAAMAVAGGHVGRAEVAPFVARLLANGQAAAARRIWLRYRESGDAPVYGGVSNGNFETPLEEPGSAYPFEWKTRDSAGGYTAIDSPPMLSNENTLYARSDGLGSSLIEQIVMIKPGERRLTFRVISQLARPGHAFEWQLYCFPNHSRIAPIKSSAQRRSDWIYVAIDFVVPSECPSQSLELHSVGSEQAEAWFDDVAFSR